MPASLRQHGQLRNAVGANRLSPELFRLVRRVLRLLGELFSKLGDARRNISQEAEAQRRDGVGHNPLSRGDIGECLG
ncbi:MAG: hypothetical protein HY595_04220, partial [Candidatus Omnitrophica bacterium]|nr:hypothetical protein [Candidatus Omnitrophota bacterium]